MFDVLGSAISSPADVAHGRNLGGGKTLFVSALTADPGSDDNEGTDPQYPLLTIEAALLKVTTRKHDYIFVQDFWTPSAAPITLIIRDLHLIGINNGGPGNNRVGIDGGGEAAIELGSDADGCEIAGFELGSTGAGDPGVLVSANCWKIHIHHCAFGFQIVANNGIDTGAFSFNFGSIDHNWFGGQLSTDGVSGNTNRSLIAHNIFRGYGGIGIEFGGGQVGAILSNVFSKAHGGAAGWAINITGGTGLGIIMDNLAGEDGEEPDNNPYKDATAVGVGKLNGWAKNYSGNSLKYPD